MGQSINQGFIEVFEKLHGVCSLYIDIEIMETWKYGISRRLQTDISVIW